MKNSQKHLIKTNEQSVVSLHLFFLLNTPLIILHFLHMLNAAERETPYA